MEIINNFEEIIATISFSDYWKKMQESTFLDELEEKRVEFLRMNFEKVLNNGSKADKETIHLYHSNFELEFNNFAESYKSLLLLISDESNGLFQPIKISEKLNKFSRNISFELNKKKYECDLVSERICDTNIFWLVNKALKANKSKELIAMIGVDYEYQSDNINFGFLNSKKYSILQKLSLVPNFDDNMFFSKKAKINFKDYVVLDEDDY